MGLFDKRGKDNSDDGSKRKEYTNLKISSKLFEEKKLLTETSESGDYKWNHPDLDEDAIIRKLPSDCNVVSFNLFDTLLFHPFEDERDLYYVIGAQLGYIDYKRIRLEVEAREKEVNMAMYKHCELTMDQIWTAIERETGLSKKKGMFLEMQVEKRMCYANALLQKVWRHLKEQKKKIVVIADTHLPQVLVKALLEENGFHGVDEVFLSCEHGKNKRDGSLFDVAKASIKADKILHIGDNEQKDVKMAKAHGFIPFPYPNPRVQGERYRPFDMSPITGSVYRALVVNHLYNGHRAYSMEYEFGYVYGGLFAVGFCNFIHEYVTSHEVDKILFLSRKGEILKQVYDHMFPDENTVYAYWSVQAATKLNAIGNKYEYFNRMLWSKVDQNLNVNQILTQMELGCLIPEIQNMAGTTPKYKDETGEHEYINCEKIPALDDIVTEKNVRALQYFIDFKWDMVLDAYENQREGAKRYYEELLEGCSKVCAIDIGWSGSSVLALSNLIENVWDFPCEVVGILAGTNTIHDKAPESGMVLFRKGKLIAYLYSMDTNREIMKRHDKNKNHNVYWELLLGSPTPPLLGFSYNERTQKVNMTFGEKEHYSENLQEIQKGINEFAKKYVERFSYYPYMYAISGRDAYAPFVIATSGDAMYPKVIARKFKLED